MEFESEIYKPNEVSVYINGNALIINENGVETIILFDKIFAIEHFPKERKIVLDIDCLGFTSYTIPNNPDLDKQYEMIKKVWLDIHNPHYNN